MDRQRDFEVVVEAMAEAGEAVKNYAYRVGDATSQLANVALLFGMNPNESISSRSYRCRASWHWNAARVCIDLLFRPLEKEHCRSAYLRDLKRASEMIVQ
jgi:hypothetical protein